MSLRIKTFLLLLSSVALFSGCGDDAPSPDEIAKISSDALGIPVLLWAQADDVCVKAQLTALYKEFSKAKPEQRASLVKSFKEYGAIVIQVSDDAGTVKGDIYELHLSDKMIARTRAPLLTVSGQQLGTTLSKVAQPAMAPVLYITPMAAKDTGTTKVVSTDDEKLFASLRGKPSAIDSAVLSKSVTLISSKPAPAINCGRLKSFAELL